MPLCILLASCLHRKFQLSDILNVILSAQLQQKIPLFTGFWTSNSKQQVIFLFYVFAMYGLAMREVVITDASHASHV